MNPASFAVVDSKEIVTSPFLGGGYTGCLDN